LNKIIRKAEFKKYDSTTQIILLPGGLKRNLKEINDDNKPFIAKTSQSFNSKITKDYNSNIACLPGSKINTEPIRKTRLISVKRYESNDIFKDKPVNVTQSYNNIHNFNSFKVSNSKINNISVNRSIFEESKKEKKLIEYTKSKRPDYIRNPFTSQITIKWNKRDFSINFLKVKFNIY